MNVPKSCSNNIIQIKLLSQMQKGSLQNLIPRWKEKYHWMNWLSLKVDWHPPPSHLKTFQRSKKEQSIQCTTATMHNGCNAQRLQCTMAAMHNSCNAQQLQCIKAAMHNGCNAELLQCTTAAIQNACNAQCMQCIMHAIHNASNSCISALSYSTIAYNSCLV